MSSDMSHCYRSIVEQSDIGPTVQHAHIPLHAASNVGFLYMQLKLDWLLVISLHSE